MTEVPADTAWPENDRQKAWDGDSRRPKDRLDEVLDLARSPWRGAFKAAGLHSARVRFLRRAIVAVCVIAVAVVAVLATFDPFRRLPRNISIGQVRVDGTRVTVDSPKISGLQKNGRPYEVTAQSGIQDTTTPNVVELAGIDAKIGLNDASTLKVTAEHGTYDSSSDHLVMDGSAQIKNDVGYAIFMKTARMDFKTGALISSDPVSVVLQGGTVAANQLDIENDGKVSFAGAVKSIIQPGDSENATAATPVVVE
jgi:lipopolysaccharide export system protein LptC